MNKEIVISDSMIMQGLPFPRRAFYAAFFLLAFVHLAPAQIPSFNAGKTKQQLTPGETPGTYAFSYTSTVAFSQEPAFPVTVAITDYTHKPVFQIPVNDSDPFTISRDLLPGSYWIESSVAPDKDALYWSSELIEVFIDPNGLETVNSFQNVLLHQKKITILSPDPKRSGTITEKRPLLTWQALPGAVEYQVYWLVEDAPQVVSVHGSGKTTETQFRLTEDTIPNRRYEWSVFAVGQNGERLGYWSAAYFFTPGGKETFAHAPKLDGARPKGTPYLGISPAKLPLQVTGAPGISVRSVGVGSPALQAGLQPDDVLTSFNGKPLANISLPEFINMVRAEPIGANVTVEFMRQNMKKSVTMTVAPMP